MLNFNELRPAKQPSFRNRGGLLFAVIIFLNAVAAASSGPGYLPVVGPPPLRFARRIQSPTNHFVPPVPEPAAAVAPPPAPEKLAVLPAPAPHPTDAALSPTNAQPATAAPAQLPIESPPPDGAVVSPQMLMRFFNKSTNGQTSVVAPMEFNPPRPAGPPPSTATYSTGP